MNTTKTVDRITAPIVIAACAAGLCNAVIGAGGGILLTLTIGAAAPRLFRDRREILITSQAAMIPGCILSCAQYAAEGMLDTSNFTVFAIPALIGGAIGSILLGKIKPNTLNTMFSILIIWSGIRMVGV